METQNISESSAVTLHFSLSFEDGAVIDSTFDKEPASFTMGDGSMLNGFEAKLLGMKAGDEAVFEITPEEGFGQPNPNNIQTFTKSDFSADLQIEEGLLISFADAQQSELPGVVKSVDGDTVIVDFNHPLAGRNIQFSVVIVSVNNDSLGREAVEAS